MSVRNRVPGFLNQIQFITFYAFNPCEAPFLLYIETARPIAGRIALTLLEFDLVGFVKTLIRPKWVRSWRKVARGPKRRKRRGGIPEAADMIADKLDPHRDLRVPTWTFAGNTVIKIHDQYERVFWTLFLLDTIEGFIFDTIIGTIEADKSGCPHIGRFCREDEQVTVGGAGPYWFPINIDTLRYINKAASTAGSGVRPLDGTWCVSFSCTAYAHIHDISGLRFRLVNPNTDEVYSDMGPFDLPEDKDLAVVLSARVEEGNSIHWQVHTDHGILELRDCTAFGMQISE